MKANVPAVRDAHLEARGTLSRRGFMKSLGAGLVLTAVAGPALLAQHDNGPGGRRGQSPATIDTRIHIGEDGTVTVMTGKVEMGQGARAQLTQAAAEELHVSPDQVRLIMGDTSLCPDDGGTWGSQTTPRTVPAVRSACAAAFGLLVQLRIDRGNDELTYADLAKDEEALKQAPPQDVEVTKVAEWQVLGTSLGRPNGREIVTGTHQFPSDITRPGMLYAKVLRPPSYGATLESLDESEARQMEGVEVVRDGDFVAAAAPSTWRAKQAIEALRAGAKWREQAEHVAVGDLYEHLRKTARDVPEPDASRSESAAHTLRAAYDVAYVQHVPMEPRAAVAEMDGEGKMTVWTGSQNPFGVRRDVARATGLDEDDVHVMTPDFGGGFGGKGSGEAGVEAARIARAINKPVALRWTREEEFTWAYFRPATVMEMQATLDDAGKLTSWHFVNINAGGSGVDSPYIVEPKVDEAVRADGPLRQGSYRALGSTANNFARESFMDELAEAAGQDPLAFRLAHLEPGRLRDVLEEAASHFGWAESRAKDREPGVGVGVACGNEKDSFVAACAEVHVDEAGRITIRRVTEAFECGAIMNPDNLRLQVLGAILQGIGPLLREAIEFEGGKIRNASLKRYEVPRFVDVPPRLDIHLVNRPDLPSVGAGETPLIALAPAVANAVFDATGQRVRSMPLKVEKTSA